MPETLLPTGGTITTTYGHIVPYGSKRQQPLLLGTDLIPFFGPPMVREAVARQIVDVPVLVSDIRDCCVVVVHYNAAAIVQ